MTLPWWITGAPSPAEKLAQHARAIQAAAQEPELAGRTVPEDYEAIRHRMVTGLPAQPLQVWRW